MPVTKEKRLRMPNIGTVTSHHVKLFSPRNLNVGAWSKDSALTPKTRKRITANAIRKII